MEQTPPITKFNFSTASLNTTGWKNVETKELIITRLFNAGHINFHEAAILLKEIVLIEKSEENKNYFTTPYHYPFQQFNDEKLNYWERCSCNPKNGGSGLCNCTLGASK